MRRDFNFNQLEGVNIPGYSISNNPSAFGTSINYTREGTGGKLAYEYLKKLAVEEKIRIKFGDIYSSAFTNDILNMINMTDTFNERALWFDISNAGLSRFLSNLLNIRGTANNKEILIVVITTEPGEGNQIYDSFGLRKWSYEMLFLNHRDLPNVFTNYSFPHFGLGYDKFFDVRVFPHAKTVICNGMTISD